MCVNVLLLRWILLTFFLSSFFLVADEIANVHDRIISLSPPATEQIFLLGCGDKIVGCTNYCTRPTEAEKKDKIGSLLDLNIEKIISLSPDLVIASSLTKPTLIAKIQSFGIKVVIMKSPKDFKGLLSQFIELGEIVGKRDEATKIAERSEKRLYHIKEITSRFNHKPKVVFQVGAKPMHLSGNDSFVGDFILYSGGLNILAEKKSGIYSREMIVQENPDIIFLTAMGFATDAEREEWMKFKSISAVKNNRIFIFDSSEICSPNPIELPNTVAKIAKILFPDETEKISFPKE